MSFSVPVTALSSSTTRAASLPKASKAKSSPQLAALTLPALPNYTSTQLNLVITVV